ncbi:3447_t:CDS:1, partial [Funneliformis geosporum]
AERNYAPTELECLAAVWAMENFRTYLLHQPFDLITDHVVLQWLFNKLDPLENSCAG